MPRYYAELARDAAQAAHRKAAPAIRFVGRLGNFTRDRYRRLSPRGRVLVWVAVLALVGIWEVRTSSLQSRVLSGFASTLTYTVEKGASSRIVFPRSGPLDERRGYTQLGDFSKRLEKKGYRVASQAHFSPSLAFAVRSGVTPPQPEPSEAGLVIRGEGGDTLYDAVENRVTYRTFDDIPPVIVKSLLYIENRELDKDPSTTANPAVDWARFC